MQRDQAPSALRTQSTMPDLGCGIHTRITAISAKKNGISGVTYRPVMAACKYGAAEGKSDA